MPPAVQDSSSKVGGEPKTKQKPHKSSKAKLVNLLVILILLPIHRLLHLFCHLPVPVMVFLKRNTDLPQQELYDEFSSEEDSIVEEGEVSSDVIDRQDQTEDMTYRETDRLDHLWDGPTFLFMKVTYLNQTNLITLGRARMQKSLPDSLLPCRLTTDFVRSWRN